MSTETPNQNPNPEPAASPSTDPAFDTRTQQALNLPLDQVTEAALTGVLRALDARRMAAVAFDRPGVEFPTSVDIPGWWAPILVGIFPATALPTIPDVTRQPETPQ